ncbi:hypothetical protein GKR75_07145 [Providencia sp. wls1919]|nr:hypothetical protein [Providencia sp. wls1919]
MKLSDIIAISGLLLTLITFLFNLAWPKINESLNQDESIAGKKARASCKTKIRKTLWSIVIPIFISFLALFYTNLPTVIKIFTSSKLSLWSFNIETTLYVMVEYAILAFIIFNFYLIIKLRKKIKKFE